jgi:hypothetical protein
LVRALKRGLNDGYLDRVGEGKHALWKLGKTPFDSVKHNRWGTPFYLPDTDGRGKPRLRGIRIDVEKTIIGIIRFIGRSCTTEEVLAAWGKLRDRRTSPLPNDLGRILQQRKLEKAHRLLHPEEESLCPNPAAR